MADRVLAWDAPNIDMTLSHLLGHRPSGPHERPRDESPPSLARRKMPAGRGARSGGGRQRSSRAPNALQGGKPSSPASATACFAWPKIEGSDIDDDMAAYLAEEARDASEVVIGSNETGPSTRQQSDSRQPSKKQVSSADQGTLVVGGAPQPAQLSFGAWRVKDYDLQVQHDEGSTSRLNTSGSSAPERTGSSTGRSASRS